MMQKNENSQKDNEAKPGPSFALQNTWPLTMDSSMPAIDDRALRMMEKMGYKLGSGLGKDEQGISESIQLNKNIGKRGLGHKLYSLNLTDESWDFSQEVILVNEKVLWLESQNNNVFFEEDFETWVKEEHPNKDVVGNSSFSDKEVLQNVFKAKNIFDELDITELNQARTRANPFETIRSAFFMNRAALKMANLDAACDFMFTTMEKKLAIETKITEEEGPIYFADVCAGPGGFTEYILWRKKWMYKGFGLTLRDEHDFKIADSTCASGVPFQALYGIDERGDVCNPDNLKDFTERVKNETDGTGVHFMMSDGGFCVDGQENLQEVLSKNIYLCQCLLALSILRPHGNFVTKTFDIFTPFSVGLLYLMHLCFEKVGIIKPNSSRPANSERYFVCNNLKVHPLTNIIREYMWKIAIRLWEIRNLPDRDIVEIVPTNVLMEDRAFYQYIVESNTSIGKKQIIGLKKLARFCRNPNLIEERQEMLRKQCLEYWNIPDEKRKAPEAFTVEDVLAQIKLAHEVLRVQPRYINCRKNLESTIADVNDWHYTYLYSSDTVHRTNFYAGVGYSKVYRLQINKWVKVKDLELAKGTLLYGEFVKETSLLENNEITTRYSLHVIDAVYLGAMDLQGYTFQERLKFIHIFCKAVNKESQSKYSVRVRPKMIKKLEYLPQDFSLRKNDENAENLIITMPKIGYKSVYELCDVNSVLLLKTNNSQSFQSTHVLRVQIFNTKEQTVIPSISFDELKKTVKNLLM